jgi:hypothetical protein
MVLLAFEQPDDVAHGERAFAGDGLDFAQVVGDFLRPVEPDQVLAGGAGDE